MKQPQRTTLVVIAASFLTTSSLFAQCRDLVRDVLPGYAGLLQIHQDRLLSYSTLTNHYAIHQQIAGQWIHEQDLAAPSLGSRSTALGEGVAVVAGHQTRIFERRGNGWEQVLSFFPPQPHSSPTFGIASAVGGQSIAVGDPDHGLVRILRREQGVWRKTQVLQRQQPGAAGSFGSGLAMTEDFLFVAAPLIPAIHVFENQGGAWTEVQVIPTSAHFSLAAHDDLLVVAQPSASPRPILSVYRHGPAGWSIETDLPYAGGRVAASRDRIAVSGFAQLPDGTRQMAVIVHARVDSVWQQVALLHDRHASRVHDLGPVAMREETVLVAGQDRGLNQIYVFDTESACELELELSIVPPQYRLFEPVQFSTRAGDSHDPAWVFLVEVNGVAWPRLVLSSSLDAHGNWSFPLDIPLSVAALLGGQELTFRSFSLHAGRYFTSPGATLSFP